MLSVGSILTALASRLVNGIGGAVRNANVGISTIKQAEKLPTDRLRVPRQC